MALEDITQKTQNEENIPNDNNGNTKKEEDSSMKGAAVGVAVGAAVGSVLGAVGTAAGAAVGLAIGSALEEKKEKNKVIWYKKEINNTFLLIHYFF